MITNLSKELAIYKAVWGGLRPSPAVICAWCPGFKPTVGGQSHGICKDCARKMEEADMRG